MRALALVLFAACSYQPGAGKLTSDGPLGDGPLTPDTPDTPEIDAPLDAFVGPPPSACVTKWLSGTPPSFTTPEFVRGGGAIATQADERDPWLTKDQLIIYFSRPITTDTDVLFATRVQVTGDFSSPFIKTSLSDDAVEDSKVAITDDDLTAFIATRRANGEGASDIWQATRATGGTALFDALTQTHLGAVNDGGNQLDPHVSADGLRLYYANGSPQQIVVSSRVSATSDFSAPVVIAGIGDPAGDADPTLTADERVLIFSSQRTGLGGTDLWYATRAERDQPFGAVQALTFNSTDNDADPHVTADGCRIYFATERFDGNDFDLFVTDMMP